MLLKLKTLYNINYSYFINCNNNRAERMLKIALSFCSSSVKHYIKCFSFNKCKELHDFFDSNLLRKNTLKKTSFYNTTT